MPMQQKISDSAAGGAGDKLQAQAGGATTTDTFLTPIKGHPSTNISPSSNSLYAAHHQAHQPFVQSVSKSGRYQTISDLI